MNKQITIIALACALVLGLALAGTALAHAKLSSSVPAAGAKLSSAPAKVTLVFSEEVSDKADETNFTVDDAAGKKIASGKLDNTDTDHKTLSAALPSGLGNGVYTVTWRTVTPDDGGISTGTFSFGVNADPGPQTNVGGEEQEPDATALPTRAATVAATAAATVTRAATTRATVTVVTVATGAATATPAAGGGATTLPNTGGDASAGAWGAAAVALLLAGALVLARLARGYRR